MESSARCAGLSSLAHRVCFHEEPSTDTMSRSTFFRALTLGVLGLTAATAAPAQIVNHPVYFQPNHGPGLTLAVDFGLGLNAAAELAAGETPRAFGGRVTLGGPLIQFTVGASSVSPGGAGASELGFGGNVALTLFTPTRVPVVVNLQSGIGYTTFGENGASELTVLDVPLGVGVALAATSVIEPWVAPRVHITRQKLAATGIPGADRSGTKVGVGLSGGINVRLPAGFGAHAAVDYLSTKTLFNVTTRPLKLGVGISYKFASPNLGMWGARGT